MILTLPYLELFVVAVAISTATAAAILFLRYGLRHRSAKSIDAMKLPDTVFSVIMVVTFGYGIYSLFDTAGGKTAYLAVLLSAAMVVAAYTMRHTCDIADRKRRLLVSVNIMSVMALLYYVLCIGIKGGITWVLPDMVTVEDNAYDVDRTYHFPGNGISPFGSYIDNRTTDTLYRIVVVYAIPGKDLYNIYTVTDTFPPAHTAKMPGRADYTMRQVPPLMPWSTDRGKRYRTQHTFVVDRRMLDDFLYGHDMNRFGLYPHRYVDSIKESSNRTIKEAQWRLDMWKGLQ